MNLHYEPGNVAYCRRCNRPIVLVAPGETFPPDQVPLPALMPTWFPSDLQPPYDCWERSGEPCTPHPPDEVYR